MGRASGDTPSSTWRASSRWVGVPVFQLVVGDGEVRAGVLPAGRYAAVAHVGHPDTLEQATRELLDWAAARGLAWDVTEVDGVER